MLGEAINCLKFVFVYFRSFHFTAHCSFYHSLKMYNQLSCRRSIAYLDDVLSWDFENGIVKEEEGKRPAEPPGEIR